MIPAAFHCCSAPKVQQDLLERFHVRDSVSSICTTVCVGPVCLPFITTIFVGCCLLASFSLLFFCRMYYKPSCVCPGGLDEAFKDVRPSLGPSRVNCSLSLVSCRPSLLPPLLSRWKWTSVSANCWLIFSKEAQPLISASNKADCVHPTGPHCQPVRASSFPHHCI